MLSIERLDNLIRRAGLLFITGLALGILAHFADIGATIAIHLIGFGALLGCVESYRSERGIWMLALLFGRLFLAVVIAIEVFGIVDAFCGAPQPSSTVVLEFAVAMQLQWLIGRALLCIVAYNRRFTS